MVSERTQRRRRRKRELDRGVLDEPRSQAFSESGVEGGMVFGGINLDEVLNLSYRELTVDDIQTMLDMDGHARALYTALKIPIMRNARRARMAPVAPGRGTEEKEFMESNILGARIQGGMTIPFHKVVSHQCVAMAQGFKAFEKVLDRPGTVVDDGYIRLRKLAPRDGRTVKFLTDNTGGFDGFKIDLNWKNKQISRTIEREYAVYFSINEEENKFYGKSMFLPAYYHFDKKHKMYFVTHMALSVGALPPRVAKEPPAADKKTKQDFLDALSNLGLNSALLIPRGFEFVDHNFEGANGSLPYMEIIEHHNRMMSNSVLAGILDTDEGGFAAGKQDLGMLLMHLEEIEDSMADMWNEHVIPDLVHWNFGTTNLPKIEFPPFSEDTRRLTEDIYGKLMSSRTIHSSPQFLAEIEKKMAEAIGLSVNPSDIDAHATRIIEQQFDRALAEVEQIAKQSDAVERTSKAAEKTANKPTPAPEPARRPVAAGRISEEQITADLAPEIVEAAVKFFENYKDTIRDSRAFVDLEDYDYEDDN